MEPVVLNGCPLPREPDLFTPNVDTEQWLAENDDDEFPTVLFRFVIADFHSEPVTRAVFQMFDLCHIHNMYHVDVFACFIVDMDSFLELKMFLNEISNVRMLLPTVELESLEYMLMNTVTEHPHIEFSYFNVDEIVTLINEDSKLTIAFQVLKYTLENVNEFNADSDHGYVSN